MQSLEHIILLLQQIRSELETLNESREIFWWKVKEEQDRQDYKAQDYIDKGEDPF